MTAPTPICPVCQGPQLTEHPGGILEIRHHSQCPLLAAEDATRVADSERALGPIADYERPPSTTGPRAMPAPFTRPATAAERTLLAAFGYAVPTWPHVLLTSVDYESRGVRLRHWPTERMEQ